MLLSSIKLAVQTELDLCQRENVCQTRIHIMFIIYNKLCLHFILCCVCFDRGTF